MYGLFIGLGAKIRKSYSKSVMATKGDSDGK